jgi:drug/metabolite transporter (DMT)-like permease
MVTYLTPVATLVLAVLILGEQPLPLQLVGGAVIVIGVRLAARRSGVALRQTPAGI